MSDQDLNPYQPAKPIEAKENTDGLLTKRLNDLRKERDRWAKQCWFLGLFLVALGVIIATIANRLSPNDKNLGSFFTTVDIGALVFIVFGCLCIVFGPVSWYWFKNKR